MDRPLGFCTVCIRVRWLERVTGVDRLLNKQGICSSCAREEGGQDEAEIVELNMDQVRTCPHTIMDPRHYEDYEQYTNCSCYDPDNDLMVDWGYTWNEDEEVWE